MAKLILNIYDWILNKNIGVHGVVTTVRSFRFGDFLILTKVLAIRYNTNNYYYKFIVCRVKCKLELSTLRSH